MFIIVLFFQGGKKTKEQEEKKVDYHTHPSMPMRILLFFSFTLTVSSWVERRVLTPMRFALCCFQLLFFVYILFSVMNTRG